MATSAPDAGIPAVPPRLRPRPQRHDVGLRYADEQAFLADKQAWQAEQEQREELMRERRRAQQRARDRDRSGRQRGAGDNERRIRQRRAANPNMMPHEVVDAFLELDNYYAGARTRYWCKDDLESPTAIAIGLPPPQCLVDFLAGGGSGNARVPCTHENDRCRTCSHTPSLCTAHRRSLHVHAANVCTPTPAGTGLHTHMPAATTRTRAHPPMRGAARARSVHMPSLCTAHRRSLHVHTANGMRASSRLRLRARLGCARSHYAHMHTCARAVFAHNLVHTP